jgi:hypothetical protein
MNLRAGFAETEITPVSFPVRTYFSSATEVMDPLFAHAAVFDDGKTQLAFLSLDVVIVEAEYVARIRKNIAVQRNIPESNIMVCATHNHACPAVVDRPGSAKDESYLDFMIARGIDAVIKAFDALEDVELGVNSGYEGRVSFNRRYIKKNGTVVSQPIITAHSDDILCSEGVIDPELGVVSVKNTAGKIVGMLVNFACHAVHHMGSLSAGYPGVICDKIKEFYGSDCVCVFLNGACGNVIHKNYSDWQQDDTKEATGTVLANDIKSLVDQTSFKKQATLAVTEVTEKIKYRDISGLEQNINQLEQFNVFEPLITKGWYKYSLEKLKQMHAKSEHEEAIIQVFKIGDVFFGSAPCEYFAENALKIKERSPAEKTFVVSLANGWLGYIPHKVAFDRKGGHESTWAIWSKMEPAAGDIIADKILTLIKEATS